VLTTIWAVLGVTLYLAPAVRLAGPMVTPKQLVAELRRTIPTAADLPSFKPGYRPELRRAAWGEVTTWDSSFRRTSPGSTYSIYVRLLVFPELPSAIRSYRQLYGEMPMAPQYWKDGLPDRRMIAGADECRHFSDKVAGRKLLHYALMVRSGRFGATLSISKSDSKPPMYVMPLD